MNKRKAIRLLRDMKAELDRLPVLTIIPEGPAMFWMRRIHSYGGRLFQTGTPEHDMLVLLELSIYTGQGSAQAQSKRIIEEAKMRIDQCIDSIKKFGLYKAPKKNFLETLNNGWILFMLGALGSGAFLVGKYTSDVDAMETRRELKTVQERLEATTSALAKMKAERDAAYTRGNAEHSNTGEQSAHPSGK